MTDDSDTKLPAYQAWNVCGECFFQGSFEFQTLSGEDYSDSEALGFLLESKCPGCGLVESVFVAADEYHEMVMLAKSK